MDYKQIGRLLQIDRGHVNVKPDIAKEYGLDRDLKGDKAIISAFNKIAESEDLRPLRDPKGYMALDVNAYDYLKGQYRATYEKMRDDIESGMMAGGSYGIVAILSNLDGVVRKDARNALPKNFKYSELHFTPVDEGLKTQIADFAHKRANLTFAYMNKRSFEKERLVQIRQDFIDSGAKFADLVTDSWKHKEKGNVLSIKTLLKNSHNNQEGFDAFKRELSDPDTIKKDNENGIYAQYTTKTMPEAKFLLSNKKYLKDFGFDIKKGRGNVTMSWSSPSIDKKYKARNLNLDGLNMQKSSQL